MTFASDFDCEIGKMLQDVMQMDVVQTQTFGHFEWERQIGATGFQKEGFGRRWSTVLYKIDVKISGELSNTAWSLKIISNTSSPKDEMEFKDANRAFSSITGRLPRSRAALSLRLVIYVPESFEEVK